MGNQDFSLSHTAMTPNTSNTITRIKQATVQEIDTLIEDILQICKLGNISALLDRAYSDKKEDKEFFHRKMVDFIIKNAYQVRKWQMDLAEKEVELIYLEGIKAYKKAEDDYQPDIKKTVDSDIVKKHKNYYLSYFALIDYDQGSLEERNNKASELFNQDLSCSQIQKFRCFLGIKDSDSNKEQAKSKKMEHIEQMKAKTIKAEKKRQTKIFLEEIEKLIKTTSWKIKTGGKPISYLSNEEMVTVSVPHHVAHVFNKLQERHQLHADIDKIFDDVVREGHKAGKQRFSFFGLNKRHKDTQAFYDSLENSYQHRR